MQESLPFGRDNADTQGYGEEALEAIATEMRETMKPAAVPAAPTVPHQLQYRLMLSVL